VAPVKRCCAVPPIAIYEPNRLSAANALRGGDPSHFFRGEGVISMNLYKQLKDPNITLEVFEENCQDESIFKEEQDWYLDPMFIYENPVPVDYGAFASLTHKDQLAELSYRFNQVCKDLNVVKRSVDGVLSEAQQMMSEIDETCADPDIGIAIEGMTRGDLDYSRDEITRLIAQLEDIGSLIEYMEELKSDP